ATHDLLVPTFSTTGRVEKAAAEVVLLDTLQSYFSYEFVTCCGIPKVTLEGSAEDWHAIVARVQKMTDLGLEWWTKPLLPVLNQFVAASRGKVDRGFWQSIYKLNDASGGPYITGWINAFFPYLRDWQTGLATHRNELLARGGKQTEEL